MKHGTVSAYGHGGCRCDACKGAKREYAEELYRRKLAAGEVPHGVTGYRYGCRCGACVGARSSRAASERQADRARQAKSRELDRNKYNAKAREKRSERHASPVPDGIRHGEAAYSNYGCRCSVCAEAARESARRIQRDRQAATIETAYRSGYRWTGAELELVATRTDLTIEQLAKMLGRTAFAVRDARTRATHDPKWRQVAGVDA